MKTWKQEGWKQLSLSPFQFSSLWYPGCLLLLWWLNDTVWRISSICCFAVNKTVLIWTKLLVFSCTNKMQRKWIVGKQTVPLYQRKHACSLAPFRHLLHRIYTANCTSACRIILDSPSPNTQSSSDYWELCALCHGKTAVVPGGGRVSKHEFKFHLKLCCFQNVWLKKRSTQKPSCWKHPDPSSATGRTSRDSRRDSSCSAAAACRQAGGEGGVWWEERCLSAPLFSRGWWEEEEEGSVSGDGGLAGMWERNLTCRERGAELLTLNLTMRVRGSLILVFSFTGCPSS